jgi:HEAT repeat protein
MSKVVDRMGQLLAQLQSPDFYEREEAVKELRTYNEEEVVTGLAMVIDVLDSVDEVTLKRLSRILREAGPSATELILEKLAGASSRTKLVLMDIFKQFIDDNIAEKLEAFADDPDPEIRRKVAYTLGMAGYTGAVSTLKKLAVDDVGHVRAAAFSALGWLCSEEEADFLFMGLRDKYPDVREAAMGALVIVNGPKVVAKFTADLYHQETERQRLAVTALGLIGETEVVVDPLLKAINHPETSVRKSAINALARIGEVSNVQPLTLALNDEDSEVRMAAISALIAVRGEQAVPEIKFLLDDEDVGVRCHTISSIGDLGLEKFSDYLMPYLEDEQDILKIAATKALAQMGCQRALPELKKLRRKKNKDVVRAVETAVLSLERGRQ